MYSGVPVLLERRNASEEAFLSTLRAMGTPGKRIEAVLQAVATHADENWTIVVLLANHGCRVLVEVYNPYPQNKLAEHEFPFRGTVGDQDDVVEEIRDGCVSLFERARKQSATAGIPVPTSVK